MLKKTIALLVFSSFIGGVALNAEPTPSSKKKSSRKTKKQTTAVAPLPLGWSVVNGIWTHSDGYKFVNGQLLRIGTHPNKRPPSPPTKAQMDAVMKKNVRKPMTAEEIAAAKAAERERNLRPRPASQTGSNL